MNELINIYVFSKHVQTSECVMRRKPFFVCFVWFLVSPGCATPMALWVTLKYEGRDKMKNKHGADKIFFSSESFKMSFILHSSSHQKLHVNGAHTIWRLLSMSVQYGRYRSFQHYHYNFCSMLFFWAIFQLSKTLDAILIHYSCSCPKNVILVLLSFPRARSFLSPQLYFFFLPFCTSPTFGLR